MNDQEYEQLEEKALKQFKSDQALFGKNGTFVPMLKSFLGEAFKNRNGCLSQSRGKEQGAINETVKKPSVSKAQTVLL